MSLTQLQDKNKVIIACAGSGKTSYLVDLAIKSESRTLLLTYTNENLANIEKVFYKENGFVPPKVKIQSWFTFLLSEGVRPYHNFLSSGPRVTSINFVNGSLPHMRYVSQQDVEKF